MARLVAIGVLFWAVYSSIGYSVENFPKPAIAAEAGPSPVEAMVEADIGPEPLPEPEARTAAFTAGVYAIGDSPDPKDAARDRDYRPRRRLFVTDERYLDSGSTSSTDDSDDDSTDDSTDDSSDDSTDDSGDDESTGNARRLVEGEIEPGLYATAFGTENCSFELWRVMQDRNTRVIGEEHLSEGRLLVTIDGVEPDWFTPSDDCGDWYQWQPVRTSLTVAGDGDYWVGDLENGVWYAPAPCRWEKVVSFRGARLSDVVDSGSGPGSLVIDDETLGVRVRGCRASIKLTSPESAYDAP
ncbi:MAG: hypothetical protein ACR2QO_00155 [Acidimicrobiales bacterium]